MKKKTKELITAITLQESIVKMFLILRSSCNDRKIRYPARVGTCAVTKDRRDTQGLTNNLQSRTCKIPGIGAT
jgi:hypothetical protein